MTTYGLTSTGFARKTYTDILTSIETWQRAKISEKLDLTSRTILGNVNAIVCDELAQGWEALEAAVGALDPDNAVETLLVGLCKLTGVVRKGADYGHARGVTLTFDRAVTIPAHTLLLAVTGEDTNLWSNDIDIVSTGAGTVSADFTSVTPGPAAAAAAGTLTVIKTPIGGLLSATNSTDAASGTPIQSLDELRTARENSLAATGKGTAAAIAAAVAKVDGVIDCRVFENDTSETVGSLPKHSSHVMVWDGVVPAAANADIAQAIYSAKSAASETYGTVSANAADPWGATKTMHFDRVTQVPIYVTVAVTGSVSAAVVKSAIIAAHAQVIDNDVTFASLVSAVFNTAGVTRVPSLTLGTAPAPTGVTDISISNTQVGVLSAANITVTIT